jgi:hypothetical protein
MNFEDMTSSSAARCYDKCGAVAKEFPGGIAGSLPVLMAALEAGLEESRKALLALDLAGLVKGTREQVLLSRELAAVLYENGQSAAVAGPPDLAGELGRQQMEIDQVRIMGRRIIGAIRLQHALLARSQSKLRVMANMRAGPSAAYGPMLASRFRGHPRG